MNLNPPDVILANFLLMPLIAFLLFCAVWLITGVADFLDGLFYWRAHRPGQSDPAQPVPTARRNQGAGCLWAALLSIISLAAIRLLGLWS